MKPAPTAAEIAEAREWLGGATINLIAMAMPATAGCARVLLSALDAAEARVAAEYQRGWDANVEAAREIFARAEAAEKGLANTREALRVASQEVFKFKRETGEWKEAHRLKVIRAETAERELDEARAATKRLRQSIADLGDSEDLVGCDGNEMLEAVLDRMAQFDDDEAHDAALAKEAPRG